MPSGCSGNVTLAGATDFPVSASNLQWVMAPSLHASTDMQDHQHRKEDFIPPPALRERIERLLAVGGRRLLGIAGAPGSGKSTLAAALANWLGEQACVVPMDGYHLANAELRRLGRTQRKGAPDTFDSAGYADLLRRLGRQPAGEVVYVPEFRREIEEPVAGAIAVDPGVQLVITEGNYLLLEQGHWAGVAQQLDEVWYVELDEALRRQRLQQRHMRFGRDAETAQSWIEHTDEPNARLIEATRHRAHWIWRTD
jgi:pantothenate kinase